MTAIITFLRLLFPWPEAISARDYESRYEGGFSPTLQIVEATSRLLSPEMQKQFYETACQYVTDEDGRAASVISRAQAMLVAQTFFGAILALATGLIGKSEALSGLSMWAFFALLGYTLIQVCFLTVNALRAIRGVPYRKIGVREVADWLPKSEPVFFKNMGLLKLRTYWSAHVLNTWKVNHLALAHDCLRNIVFALTVLVRLLFVLLGTNQFKAASASTPTSSLDIEKCIPEFDWD